MPLAHSAFSTVDTSECIQTLPTYCRFFKFMLIEELLLQDDYCQVHYGNCRVIGTILRESDGKVFLQNLRIHDLPSKYSLPEGTLKLRLLGLKEPCENNSVVEVLGEFVLNTEQEDTKYPKQLTSRAYCELLNAVKNGAGRSNLENQFKNCYTPTLNVFLANTVDNASDLISRNLEIRILQLDVNALQRRS